MILVVDDDPQFLEKAREILNRDRKVFFALDGQQAVKLAADLGFSVALVNLDGGINGLQLIEQLRHHFPDLPVIAISSLFTPTLLHTARTAGAVEVLPKPITPAWKPAVERIRAKAHRRESHG